MFIGGVYLLWVSWGFGLFVSLRCAFRGLFIPFPKQKAFWRICFLIFLGASEAKNCFFPVLCSALGVACFHGFCGGPGASGFLCLAMWAGFEVGVFWVWSSDFFPSHLLVFFLFVQHQPFCEILKSPERWYYSTRKSLKNNQTSRPFPLPPGRDPHGNRNARLPRTKSLLSIARAAWRAFASRCGRWGWLLRRERACGGLDFCMKCNFAELLFV